MLSSLLLYFGLPFGGLGLGAVMFFFLTPWGPAALTLIANSKVARFALAGAGAALAIGLACLKAFNAGKADARGAVDQANAEAKAERQNINASTAAEPDDALRKELGTWSPKP